MKRNTFIKTLSLVMAAGVILGSYGCKADDNKKAHIGKDKSEIPSITTIIEYTSIDNKGHEKKATNIIDNFIPEMNNKVEFGPLLSEKFSDDKDAKEQFKKNIKSYGSDEKKYEEIIKNAANWQTFTYDYYVVNPYSQRIAFRTITSTTKDGILIDNDLGCEKSIPSGKGSYILLEGMVDTSKFKDEASIKEALKAMNPQIVYTFVQSIDETVEDWSKIETKKLPMNIAQ